MAFCGGLHPPYLFGSTALPIPVSIPSRLVVLSVSSGLLSRPTCLSPFFINLSVADRQCVGPWDPFRVGDRVHSLSFRTPAFGSLLTAAVRACFANVCGMSGEFLARRSAGGQTRCLTCMLVVGVSIAFIRHEE